MRYFLRKNIFIYTFILNPFYLIALDNLPTLLNGPKWNPFGFEPKIEPDRPLFGPCISNPKPQSDHLFPALGAYTLYPNFHLIRLSTNSFSNWTGRLRA